MLEVKSFEGVKLLNLKVEEEATGRGMQVTSRNWKRQGKKFSSSISRRNAALLAPQF